MLSVSISQNVTTMDSNLTSVFRRSMIGATELIRREASLNAPYQTGTLRRSITTSISFDGMEGRVGSNLPYARRREFENYKNPHTKYYMKRARDSSASQVESIFVKELDIHFSKGI